MAGNVIASRGEVVGQRIAAGLKRLMALERDLIERAGRWSGAVKWGLHLIRLSIALSLVSLTLWTLIVVLPFVLIAWLIAASNDGEDSAGFSGSLYCSDDSDYDFLGGDGYRSGSHGYGHYVDGCRIDTDD